MKKKTVEVKEEIPSVEPEKFSDEELQEFKTLLDEKLSVANKELDYLRDKIAGITGSESYNAKSGNPELEQMIGLRDRQTAFIEKLDEALKRIEDKTYGICKVTGKLIDKARLRAVPHATLSIEANRNKESTQAPPIEMPAPGIKTEESAHVEATQVSTTDEPPKQETPPVRKCRVCGCTDDNCSQCIEKTGLACHWVGEDLCSACVEPEKAETNTSEEFDIDWITQEVYFFRGLYPMLDGINVEMKIKRLNGKLIVEVLPETASVIKPIKLTGTAEEMDEGFFGVITKPVTDAKELKFDVETYNKSVLEAKAKNKPVSPKPEQKKPAVNKSIPKKTVAKKPPARKPAEKQQKNKPSGPLEKPPAPKGGKQKNPNENVKQAKLKPAAPDMFAGIS